MKKFILLLIGIIFFPTLVNSEHLYEKKEIIINTKSTKESINLARFLSNKGVVKYSAYWCPNCHYQSQLFGKEAYKELNVIECARDGKNSQTQICIDKKIKGLPSWEINGKIILGVKTLRELSKMSGYKN